MTGLDGPSLRIRGVCTIPSPRFLFQIPSYGAVILRLIFGRRAFAALAVWLLGATALLGGVVTVCGGGSDAGTPPAVHTPNASVKVMPLGDSITQSTTGLASYRYYLWHLLLRNGYQVDFVGSEHGVGGGPPAHSDFDMDHEGHSGWRADQIATHVHAWAAAASPDVVLLHIGTNDLWQRQSVASTVTDIGDIIDTLRTVNPRIRILLAQLIAQTGDSFISSLNAALPALAAGKNRPESPIILVDQFTGFDPSSMTYDGTHPNDAGDSRMADRWYEKLAPALDALLAGAARAGGWDHPTRN
jgi:lysophospholipase L1-like esterase